MISFEQALTKILQNTQVLPAERIAVEESVGSVLAQDIYSAVEMPPFNKSAVDGYALKCPDSVETAVKLKCIGSIKAGSTSKIQVKKGQCVKIMTGAPIPKGADSVVMVEYSAQSNNYVKILRSVKKGQNICLKGEDVKLRQKVMAKGTKVSTSDIALLATVGRRFIKAVRKPTVAFLNTGDEVVPVGRKLPKNKIYNSNGPQLQALLKSEGLPYKSLGIIKDEPQKLSKAVEKGLSYDVLLISGGVSMGDYDLIPQILEKRGVKKVFHNVKIKPGKPLFFGKHKKTLIFGVPGNPVSNFTTYLLFIRPALYKMTGYKNYMPQFLEGTIEEDFTHKRGRTHFVPVKVLKKEAQYTLMPLNSHGSADIVALSKADAF
ncbi:MAG: molybdopterin molybdotransferase MoeA, partial [Candidatus Omnitrophota bacterium]